MIERSNLDDIVIRLQGLTISISQDRTVIESSSSREPASGVRARRSVRPEARQGPSRFCHQEHYLRCPDLPDPLRADGQ